MIFFLLAMLTLIYVKSSLFALYIVTLPDMTPMKALRSARELARYRRWTVLRKILGPATHTIGSGARDNGACHSRGRAIGAMDILPADHVGD